jgi:hypothetical protein
MRPLYTVVATLGLVLLAAPVSASTLDAPSAASDCAPDPCGTINSVCQKVFHISCVGLSSADSEVAAGVQGPHCVGLPCDVINAVCYIATKQWCVG